MVGCVIVKGAIREDSEEMTLDRDQRGEVEPALCRPGGRALQAEGTPRAKGVCRGNVLICLRHRTETCETGAGSEDVGREKLRERTEPNHAGS